MVLPDNVLFEARRCASPSRSAFDRKPAQEKPWTEKLWIYDLRNNQHFTLQRADLDDFVACWFGNIPDAVGRATSPRAPQSGKKGTDGAARRPYRDRFHRVETDRFKGFTYEELVKRDKVNLDIFWLKDDALEDSANLPAPHVIAEEITGDLKAALEQFSEIVEDLKPAPKTT